MKIFVKTLRGTRFKIEVNLEDTIADVKKNIESVQGQDVYPAARQMLIQQGQILKDGTTLEENKVAENSYIIIMLSKPVAERRTAPPPPPVAAPFFLDPNRNSGIPEPPERVGAPPPPPPRADLSFTAEEVDAVEREWDSMNRW